MIDLAALNLPALPEPLAVPTVDAHTHLDSVAERTGLSAGESLDLAESVGVAWVAQAGDTATDSRFAVDLARTDPRVIACVALHPNEVARHPERYEEDFAEIRRLAQSGPHVRAIGETGLDYFRTMSVQGQALQHEAFARHIALCVDLGLTLVIHDRDAHEDVLRILDESPKPARVIMHSFSGDADHARACVERGYWLSFPGVTTYNANHHLRRALALTPDEKVLVETDAPYLTPVPARGRPNGPYLIPYTLRFLAAQKKWTEEEACIRLRENAFAAYGGLWGHAAPQSDTFTAGHAESPSV